MLRAADLSFAYGNTPVVCDVSLDVADDGFVGIIGPNGSGKTTLLRLLAGTRTPERGSVTLDGKPLEKGIIMFSAAEGEALPVAADVIDGKYSTEKMVAGKKHVQLSASKLTGTRKNDSPGAPPDEMWEEQIPARYNTESTLSLDVQPGSNAKDWAVESIRGKR